MRQVGASTKRLWLSLGAAFAGIFLWSLGIRAQSGSAGEEQATPLIRSVEGPALFRSYCASCHGVTAKGDGPAAPALRAKLPDLTLLAAKNQGQFPAAHVREVIMGDKVIEAHGSREMPIWGPIFHQIEADVDRGNVRLENLVKYLQSIQQVPTANSPSGAQLYARNCAVCHGDDLRGTGSAPYPFRAPPDLTTLTHRHGGNFPGAYVSKILRSGVVIPAHGPAEMPVWGDEFTSSQLSGAEVTSRIDSLTMYLKSRQAN